MNDDTQMPEGWQGQFLGEELQAAENDRDSALFHIIPCGLEKTVSYGSGTAHGPQAIIEASHQLERLYEGAEPCQKGIFTRPEIDCTGDIKSCLAQLEAAVYEAVSGQHVPIILGGEHSLTYGAMMGVLKAVTGPVGIIQIDAHADLRKAYQGQPHSHASVMHLLAQKNVPIFQLGVRALCREEADRRAEYNIEYIDAAELVRGQISQINLPDSFPEQIYISFDLDGLDPSIMAATGTPVAGGLGFYQVLDLLASATCARTIIGADIVELAPHPAHTYCDFTAAQICYALMGLAAQQRR